MARRLRFSTPYPLALLAIVASASCSSCSSGDSSSNPGGGTPGVDGGSLSADGGSNGAASDAAGTPAVDAGVTPHAGKWRIMPLGDSITGNTCYPQLLSAELIAKGHASFEFIGTNLNDQSCGANAPSLHTEGHGGYLATYLLTNNPPVTGKGTLGELQSWIAEKPDVVLLEIGTNDVWSSVATTDVLDAYGFIVDQFRTQNSAVIFFVAQITPMNPAGCAGCESRVEALNAQIPGWAASKATAASPIHVVNVWSALPAATYTPNSANTSDGVHPNQAGSQLMADVWSAGITAQGIP